MFRYFKGFASYVTEKQTFSISKSRQKHSNVHKATMKSPRKKKSPSFPLNHKEKFIKLIIKCSNVTFFVSIIVLGFLDIPASEPKWSYVVSQRENLTLPLAASTHKLLPFKGPFLICRTGEKPTLKQNPTLYPSNTKKHHPPPFRSMNVSPSVSLVPRFQQAVWNLPANFVLKHAKEVILVSEVDSWDWEKNFEVLCKKSSLNNKHLNFNLIQKHEEGKLFTVSELVELKTPETCKAWLSNILLQLLLQHFCKDALSSIVMEGTDFFFPSAIMMYKENTEFLSHWAELLALKIFATNLGAPGFHPVAVLQLPCFSWLIYS